MLQPSIKKGLYVIVLAFCASPWTSAPLALVCGFLFTLFFGHPYAHLGSKVTSWLLKIAVVGLGFGLDLHSAIRVGKEGFLLTVSSIVIILVLGYLFGRLLKLPTKLSHLVSSGTAICGGSAIAAVAPTVRANENEISMSLGVVFLLNSVALLVFPVVGHLFEMSQSDFGLWCAVAIHDTSSVVGAASAYGSEALNVATTVKLARALWIIPLSILSIFLFRSKSKKISIPWFIGFFIIAMTTNSYIPRVGLISPTVVMISKSILVITLFLIGSSLSIQKIKIVGFKPLVLGVMLWIIISCFSLIYILK